MKYSSYQEIAELLILTTYEDEHLSIAEDSMLQNALRAIGWTNCDTADPKLQKAFAAARDANSSVENKEAFLQERTTTIRESGESPIALEWLEKILASDTLVTEEADFLERIQKML